MKCQQPFLRPGTVIDFPLLALHLETQTGVGRTDFPGSSSKDHYTVGVSVEDALGIV